MHVLWEQSQLRFQATRCTVGRQTHFRHQPTSHFNSLVLVIIFDHLGSGFVGNRGSPRHVGLPKFHFQGHMRDN